MKRPRLAVLLVFACAGAAAMLAASEFMTTFELTTPGGEALQASDAADRHNYAILVLAIFALAALLVAVGTGSQVAAFAVAASGLVALMIFLIGDLPDANKVGALDNATESFTNAKAVPQLGFWLELAGSLLLAVCGAALATLKPEQLKLAGGSKSEQPTPPEKPKAAEQKEPAKKAASSKKP
ncbi:MAG: hypothetical protein EXQ70_08950 [Solirubrobacterales bacterium]|nr:hypothetical protein [Solirubrobacterales bacterium]